MNQSKKHILVISQYFYPEPFRINDICMEWIKRGYEVTVITGIPNYPEGNFYKGYGFLRPLKEEHSGIHILHLPIIPRKKGTIGLIANYISFVISGFFWSLFSKTEADCVFVFEVSPMTQALPGVWYAKKKKKPCFIYVQDLWPENVEVVMGIHNRLLIGCIRVMTQYIYHGCKKVFVTSAGFKQKISGMGIPNQKIIFWPQYAEEFYKPVKKYEKTDEIFRIAFTGNIGKAQGLEILPKAAAYLKDKPVQFVIVGDGRCRQELEAVIKKLEVEKKFLFMGRKKPNEIPEILSQCDAAFLSFMNNSLFCHTIPAKLQTYMACGMPIIASADGESQHIIEESGCGLCCRLGDAKALAKNISRMMAEEKLKDMSRNSLKYCNENFNKKKLMDQMDAYLNI